MINVKDFGAIGDGTSNPLSNFFLTLAAAQAKYPCAQSLTDETDWAAIQTAVNTSVFQYPLNYAPSPPAPPPPTPLTTGSTIYLPEGIYLINRTININNVGTWLVGDGMTTTTICVTAVGKTNGMTFAISFNNTDQGPPLGIRHLEVKNFPFGPIGCPTYCAGVAVNGTNVVFLDHLWVNGMLGGVYTTGSGDNIYESCYCEENVNYGFLTDSSAPMRFINCSTFSNQGIGFSFQPPPSGGHAQAPYGTLMTGCQSVADGNVGFAINGYNDIDLTGCSVSGVGGTPVSGPNTQTVTGISIANANRISITGGRIINPKTTGIAITGSNVVNISNFTIQVPSAGTGIAADANSANLTMVGTTMAVASGGVPTAISAKTNVLEAANNYQAPAPPSLTASPSSGAAQVQPRRRRY